jgi:hypothetical protein
MTFSIKPQSHSVTVNVNPVTGYFTNIEDIRDKEYPSLQSSSVSPLSIMTDQSLQILPISTMQGQHCTQSL